MLKKILAGTAAVVMIASVSPIMTIANNMGNGGTSANIPSILQSDVTINAHSGEVTLRSPGAVNESVTTFRLNLTSDEEFEFYFYEDAGDKFNISYDSNNNSKKDVNIYIYKQDSLFDENSSVVIGRVTNPTAVKAENVEYVSGDDIITLDTELRTYLPESDDTSDYELDFGEKFRNLNYSLFTVTTTTTTTTEPTTTSTTTTTEPTTTSTTITESIPTSTTTPPTEDKNPQSRGRLPE
ncbi:MAG: hypothetical protein K2H19_04965, partial [Ruminococcus sp.]|nr:hypothetical protein [Ruminococcus sp.]